MVSFKKKKNVDSCHVLWHIEVVLSSLFSASCSVPCSVSCSVPWFAPWGSHEAAQWKHLLRACHWGNLPLSMKSGAWFLQCALAHRRHFNGIFSAPCLILCSVPCFAPWGSYEADQLKHLLRACHHGSLSLPPQHSYST